MSTLFQSDDPIVGKVRNVVQFLLSHDIDTAKYYRLTEICGITPTLRRRSLSAFSTDKQMFLYPIRNIFSTTLPVLRKHAHQIWWLRLFERPDLASPKWFCNGWSIDTGSSRAVLVSCKERFSEEPTHSDFISEVDNGESIVRCNGWRTPNQLQFRHKPPFLLDNL